MPATSIEQIEPLKEYPVEIVKMVLYDVGRSIDLKKVADLLPGVPGIKIVRRRDTPTSLTIPRPLCVDLRNGLKKIFVADSIEGLAASARLYDDGVLSIVVRLTVYASIKDLHGIEAKPITHAIIDMDSYIEDSYNDVMKQIIPAISSARSVSEKESYTVYCFGGIDYSPEEFFNKNKKDLATLLVGEAWDYPIHQTQINKILTNPFMYSDNDLAVFDIDRAIIIDSEHDYEDLLLICELANYQYLELRFLDKMLDKWLDEAEDDINVLAKKSSFKKIKTGALRKKFGNIQSLRMDALFILENVENSSKIIGDYFLGQVYQHICGIFNTNEWTRSVERRLKVLSDIYEIVKVERNEKTMLILDVVFILVCIILPVLQIIQVMVAK